MDILAINTTLNDRVSAFAKANSILSHYLNKTLKQATSDTIDWQARIDKAWHQAQIKNSWFTDDNLLFALTEWSQALTQDNLQQWLAAYDITGVQSKKVCIITAGNLPLVGFHDVLSTILVGHHALIKNSSNDDVLTPLLLEIATSFEPRLTASYSYNDGKLVDYDAVIATGSTNTSRYFEHYFGHKPHIIRKSRNSVAVLTGTETLEHMQALSDDVFRYFGLGCRSVSHIMVPRGYNFDLFFNGMFTYKELIKNEKYLNNYDYNKAVYLMSEFDLLDNEFLLIKEENNSYASPIATLGYSYYDSLDTLANTLVTQADSLQCIVSQGDTTTFLKEKLGILTAPAVVPFGKTQSPGLADYADGIDVVEFLLKVS